MGGEIPNDPLLQRGSAGSQFAHLAQIEAGLRLAEPGSQRQPLVQRHQGGAGRDVGVPGSQAGAAEPLDRGGGVPLPGGADGASQRVASGNEGPGITRIERVDLLRPAAQSHSHMSE